MTSKEISQRLKDAGFEAEHEMSWVYHVSSIVKGKVTREWVLRRKNNE